MDRDPYAVMRQRNLASAHTQRVLKDAHTQSEFHPRRVGDRYFGIDCARSGGDRTVISSGFDHGHLLVVDYLEGRFKQDGAKTASWLKEAAEQLPGTVKGVGVDIIGVGASVYDHVRPIFPSQTLDFAASYKPIAYSKTKEKHEKVRYANLKAQAYDNLAVGVRAQTVLLPPDEMLREQLAALQTDSNQYGKMLVVDPPDSPDYAESVMILYSVARLMRGRVWVGD